MAEVAYYFNSRSTGNWTDPDNVIDGSIDTFASTSATGTIETLDGNTCPGDDLGTITKVEVRIYGYGDGDDMIWVSVVAFVMPASPNWTIYRDLYMGGCSWQNIVDLAGDIEFLKSGKANTMHCAKVEIRVTYTPAVAVPRHGIVNFQDPGIV